MSADWRESLLRGRADIPTGRRSRLSLRDRQRSIAIAREAVPGDRQWNSPEADPLHRYAAHLLLGKLQSLQALSTVPTEYLDECILEEYNDWLLQATVDRTQSAELEQAILTGPSAIETQIEAASCSFNHPVFEWAEQRADRHGLASLVWDENLADLNFMNILLPLCYSPNGEPGQELVANLMDELGHGSANKYHTFLRRQMMRRIGLREVAPSWDLNSYPLPAVVHFNLYVLNGIISCQRIRLVGMLFATEFLVPKQLARVSRGWRRSGLDLSEDEYYRSHIEGDVEHGDGWSRRVVVPIVERRPGLASDVAAGMSQHITVLSALYDYQLARVGQVGAA